ncbi:uncharacterized protein B0I36DRAFT_430916 [Microdochium trichocladiopsis]|uniref:Fungal N-terminal domain-containing protein n=1 Tax=Microdochium trichocladiopsis TaxID=1682393 RepID=A0A9P8Y5E7_9PEZI|nr:uncharacterized protein B0I36DRAFT_430916 [Microdochium trichocladiopsis]KAH7030609.1 hypothetical protein B0I36DRAFT_430916 [Microdochium trichocladiopsis]
MAEMTGLALGAISLGIQVCKGVIVYADALRGKTDDLAGLEEKARALSGTLDAVSRTIDRLWPPPTNPPSPTAVSLLAAIANSTKACEADLSEMERFLVKYAGGSTLSGSMLRERFQNAWKRLQYGFKAGEISKMEAKLASVNSILLLALQGLGMDLAIDEAASTKTILDNTGQILKRTEIQDRELSRIQSDTTKTLQELGAAQESIGRMNRSLATTLTTSLPALHNDINEAAISAVGRVESLSTRIEDVVASSQTIHTTEVASLRHMLQVQTKAFEDLTAGLNGWILPNNRQLVVQRLTARPAMLQHAMHDMDRVRATQEQLETALYDGDPTTRDLAMCNCRPNSSTQSWRTRLGVSSFALTTRRHVSQHHPGCVLSRNSTDRPTTEHAVAAQIGVFNTVIDTALKLTYFWRQGAGGFSISPAFSICAVVDSRLSPSFRLTKLLSRFMIYNNPDASIGPVFICHYKVKLREIFQSGRASPTDLDQYGRTILHKLAISMHYVNGDARLGQESAHNVISDMVHVLGVPLEQQDHGGFLALHWYLRDLAGLVTRFHRAIKSLIPQGNGGKYSTPNFSHINLAILVAQSSYAYQICDVWKPDRLSEAIIRNEAACVRDLIYHYPGWLDDKPAFGVKSYMHLALYTAHCFEDLVSGLVMAAEDKVPNASKMLNWLLEYADSSGRTLAELVVSACSQEFHPTSHGKRCWYTSILHVLFAKRCRMRPSRLTMPPWISARCQTCLHTYVLELRDRRNYLKDIALRHFTVHQIRRYELDEDAPLDRHTALVVQELRQLQIHIPKYLITAEDDQDICPLWHSPMQHTWRSSGLIRYPSVPMCIPLASALYTFGFRDSQAPLHDGSTFLHHLIHLLYTPLPFDPANLQTLRWALQDSTPTTVTLESFWRFGSDAHRDCILCVWMTSNLNLTVAHVLAGALGRTLSVFADPSNLSSRRESWLSLVSEIMPLTLMDTSACLCSQDGRTPFVIFLQQYFSQWSNLSNFGTPTFLASHLRSVILACGRAWTPPTFQAAIRLLTFEALSMEHTCNDPPGSDCDHDLAVDLDPAPANTQTDPSVAIFSKLVKEFDSMIRAEVQVDTSEIQGDALKFADGEEGLHNELISLDDSHCESANRVSLGDSRGISQATWERWLHVWVELLDAEISDLHAQSIEDDHLKAAEKLGIKWCQPPPTKQQPLGQDMSSLEFWMGELDKI